MLAVINLSAQTHHAQLEGEQSVCFGSALDAEEPLVASGTVGDASCSLKPRTEIALHGFADGGDVVKGKLLVGFVWAVLVTLGRYQCKQEGSIGEEC